MGATAASYYATMPRRHLAVLQNAPTNAESPSAVVVDLSVRKLRRTINIEQMKRDFRQDRATAAPAVEDEGPLEYARPKSRADCLQGEFAARPCPFVSCKHHLYLDVNQVSGSIRMNFPDKEPWEIEDSCVLDVADRGGETLGEVGGLLGLTRERIRQIESMGIARIRSRGDVDMKQAVRELLAASDQLPDRNTRYDAAKQAPAQIVVRDIRPPPAAARDPGRLPGVLDPRTWKKNRPAQK